ncbi:MAG: hypothetical protein K9N23_02680 [Akkermansiaceae bacterium]|nr:hypothetical protein [Akkermansiaceae bacterium]
MNFRSVLYGLFLFLGSLFPAETARAGQLSVYQIGNSWTCINLGTWDIATSLNKPFANGYHYAWNETLTNLWTGAHSASSPEQLQTALPGMPWDIVELQPWYENWMDATTAATNMLNLAFLGNPNAKILIFACGPESSQGPYLTTWNRTDEQNYTDSNFWKSKRNYELIVDHLRTAFPGKQIGIVPMGHCIAKVATLLQEGATIPDVASVNDLLEQGGQHTSPMGSYIGQLAAYCTFFQQAPHGATRTNVANCLGSPITVSPEFAAYMWDVVWDVVLNEPYTLVMPGGTNNLAAFNFPGFGPATITGTDVSITVPYGTDVTAMAPTFNLSAGASCIPASGSSQDFSSPVHYIVSSAAPVTTQDYTVTVTVAPYVPPRIGVQRAGGLGGTGTQLTADQKAGAPGYAQPNWNTFAYSTSNASALKDSTGAVTTAAFSCPSGDSASQDMGAPSIQPDEILHSNSQIKIWGDQVFTITGIPYSSYKLVFYETASGTHDSQATVLTGGPTYYLSQTHASTAAGYVDNNASTPYTYVQATSTSAEAPTVDGNYVVFSDLSGPSQTVTIPGGFLVNNAFNAFQIVDTSIAGPPAADITSFAFGALGAATISGTSISLTVPFGTSVSSISPTFTMSSGATCDKASGSAQDFSGPLTYTVTSSDSLVVNEYVVTVTVAAASTAADMQSFNFGVLGAATISGTNITISVPYGTVVSSLSPTYTVSAGATCLPISGSIQNFTNPQTYRVTAQDSSYKDYTVTVTVGRQPPTGAGARIGVQFAGGLGGGGNPLSASETAGAPGFAQDKWNTPGSYVAGGGSSLKDNTGTATTAGFTATGFGVSGTIGNSATPDEKLNSGEHYKTWGGSSITVADIPYPNYSLIFYVLTFWDHGGKSMALTGGPTYYFSQSVKGDSAGYVDNNASTPFLYNQVTSTSSAAPTENGNYVVFSGLSGASQTVTIDQGGFNVNSISAFQIVNTTPTQTPYENWINGPAYNSPPLTAGQKLPTADPDGDGMSNQQEYAFGLNPVSGESCNPIRAPLNKAAGTFSYTRRATPATTGLAYAIWTSTNMQVWTRDTGATEGTVSTVGDVETVPVTLSSGLLANPKLFVRVEAQ